MVSRTRKNNKRRSRRVQRGGVLEKHWWQRESDLKNDETFKKLPKSMREQMELSKDKVYTKSDIDGHFEYTPKEILDDEKERRASEIDSVIKEAHGLIEQLDCQKLSGILNLKKIKDEVENLMGEIFTIKVEKSSGNKMRESYDYCMDIVTKIEMIEGVKELDPEQCIILKDIAFLYYNLPRYVYGDLKKSALIKGNKDELDELDEKAESILNEIYDYNLL